MDNYFIKLNSINCNDKTEKKNELTYLSWAYAWAEVKKLFPDANYTIYENQDGWNYHTDGCTCWVKTGVTINGIEHIEYLPVMDNRNRSIPGANVTSFDVNKAIQRSLTKAVARHGLGLYIYAGEDLPDTEEAEQPQEPQPREPKKVRPRKTQAPEYTPMDDATYWKIVEKYAKGVPTKTGGDYKQTWIEVTHAGAEQIEKFDHDVDNWRAANVPAPETRRVPLNNEF